MNSKAKKMMIAGLAAGLLMSFTSCNKLNNTESQVSYTKILDVYEDGTSPIIEEELPTVLSDAPVLETSDEDILMHMKDEEKLARDVYQALYSTWNATIFNNIQKAEQKHMDAILFLINNYSTLNGEVGAPGEFDNPEIVTLYQQLVEQGTQSLNDALTEGALIEELDIKDLATYLDQTSNENLILVLENLMKGSRNHLRAFNRQLTQLGVTYEPRYIDEAAFDEISNSPFETGNRYAKQNGKQYKFGDGSCTY